MIKQKICSNKNCKNKGKPQPIEVFGKVGEDQFYTRSECRDCFNRKRRERYAYRVANDPEYAEREKVRKRENAALARRRKGLPYRGPYKTMNGKPVTSSYFESNKRKPRPGGGYAEPSDTVDADNFAEWINAKIKQVGLAELASRSGVDPSHLMRYAKLVNKRVTLGFVDKVLIRNGDYLNSIYPDD